jgi:hypothetical protein
MEHSISVGVMEFAVGKLGLHYARKGKLFKFLESIDNKLKCISYVYLLRNKCLKFFKALLALTIDHCSGFELLDSLHILSLADEVVLTPGVVTLKISQNQFFFVSVPYVVNSREQHQGFKPRQEWAMFRMVKP